MVLAAHLNEINYAWRLDPMNHAPHFPYYVTAMVDVFPVYLPTGGGDQAGANAYVWQPKYHACVLKYQLVTTFLGDIVSLAGPFIGTDDDKGIWQDTWDLHPMEPWELFLADAGYAGAIGLLSKYRRAPGQAVLPHRRAIWNFIQEYYRGARGEGPISAFKRHGIFMQGFYRGELFLLDAIVYICGHLTAWELRNFGPRYQGYGPWAHAYT
jgi:hypothetical protein